MADRHKRLGSLKDALEEIAAAGDEARLQLSLLAAEARDRKEELEASIENLEHKLDRGFAQAVQTAAGKSRQLTKSLQEFLGRHSLQNGKREVLVSSVMMANVRSCTAEDALSRAAQIMWDVDCGAVPVTDVEHRVCRIITDRDICMAGYTQGLPLWKIRVGDVMTKAVLTCRAEQSLAEAAELMRQHQVRRLPIIDGQGHPIGILSLADIVRHTPELGGRLTQPLTFELIRAICQPNPAASPGAGRGERAAAE